MSFEFRVPSFELFCIFTFAFLLLGCSIPNLEPTTCTESRDAVREFYSYHFGNDMTFSKGNLDVRKRFLTPEFAESLTDRPAGNDVFTTGTLDLPKAFRVGDCEAVSPASTVLQVVLFWRDDVRSEQRFIKVEASKVNDKWLIAAIRN